MARRRSHKRFAWVPKPVRMLFTFLLFGGLVWAGVYAYDRGFSSKWRRFVQEEFRRHGVEFDFKRLTIDPVEGVVAREVRIFEGPERKQVLAAINRVSVDLDLTQAITKDLVVRSVDLENADLSLPINPEQPDGEKLEIKDLSARVRLEDGRLDLSGVRGMVSGLEFRVRADLLLEDEDEDKDNSEEKKREREQQMKERRAWVQRLVAELPRIRFTGNKPPTLDIELYGALDEAELIEGRIDLQCDGVEYEGFAFEELILLAEARGGAVEVRRLHAVAAGHEGEDFEASATWPGGQAPVRFEIDSRMNLVELVRHAKPDISGLAEIVFYDAPQIQVSGEFQLPQRSQASLDARSPALIAEAPVDSEVDSTKALEPKESTDDENAQTGMAFSAMGRFECGHFQSRGEHFEKAKVDFCFDGPRYFLRNARIEHRTGDLRFEAMQQQDGFRMRAHSTMAPKVARRFAQHQGTRNVIDAFEFGDEPSVLLTLEATGESFDSRTWHSVGSINLRDFEVKGVPFLRFDARTEFKDDVQWYSDITLERPEGIAKADMIVVDGGNRRVHFENLVGEVDPVATVTPFNRKVAEKMRKYRWANTPKTTLSGVLDTRKGGGENTDLHLSFESQGTAGFHFLGQDLVLPEVDGTMHFLNRDVELKVRGSIFGGRFLKETLFQPDAVFSTDFKAEHLSYKALADTYFGGTKNRGLLDLHTTVKGRSDDRDSLVAVGELSLSDGDLFSVPALGPISKLLSGLLDDPRAGHSMAREAKGTFKYAQGIATTTDFVAMTPTFQLSLTGDVDTFAEKLSMDAKVRLRGPTGVLLNPLTAPLLEFEGSGPLDEPEWAPKRLVRPLGGSAPSLAPSRTP